MAIASVHCSVLGGQVTQVTNFEGEVTAIICSEYEGSTKICRLKSNAFAGGPLAQLLERASKHTLDRRTTSCDLGPLSP